ncbi:MAG TPA: hypothetical protein VK997_09080 [Deferrisomatales bacterium]|nr:hypothetical protein [Deferrisomatales bacterium]
MLRLVRPLGEIPCTPVNTLLYCIAYAGAVWEREDPRRAQLGKQP